VTNIIEEYISQVKAALPDDYTVEVATTDKKIVFDVTYGERSYRHTIQTEFVETAGVSVLPLARDVAKRIRWRVGDEREIDI
jgi:hypothetical protein